MNIGYAKLGKSIKFDRNSWAGAGGDCEAPLTVEMLAKNNPEDTIFVVGRNDLDKFKKKYPETYKETFPHDNVVNICTGINWQGTGIEPSTDLVIQRFVDAKIDKFIINVGPTGQTHYDDLMLKKKGDGFCIPMQVFKKYAYPIFKIVNEYAEGIDVKWILNDPRYLIKAYDLLVDKYPKFYYSQYNGEYTNQGSIKKFEDGPVRNITKVTTPYKYTGIETVWLYGHEPYDLDNLSEDIKKKENVLRIVLNQGGVSGGLDRHKPLIDYIGEYGSDDYIENVEIYGKWKDDIIENDPRFKGPKTYEELQDLMATAKCTFAIPIMKGWATSKWCECFHGFKDGLPGLITFIHPWYDDQNHVYKKGSHLDNFLRVTPEQFRKRVNMIFENDKLYEGMLREQYKLLRKSYYTGEFVSKVLKS